LLQGVYFLLITVTCEMLTWHPVSPAFSPTKCSISDCNMHMHAGSNKSTPLSVSCQFTFCFPLFFKIHIGIAGLQMAVTQRFKPGSHMPPTYLGRGRRHCLGQRCGICEHLSPTDNLSQTLIAGLPAKLNSTQLRRQVGGECLGQIICRR